MADKFSSLDSFREEEIRHAKNSREHQAKAEKPEVIDFLPASSISFDEEQEANPSNTLPKIEEEKSERELTPVPEVLLECAENGMVDHVQSLINQDPSLINCRDSDGYSPLHRACYNGQLNVVKVLLQRGADVQARTEDGWQPLHCACRWGKTKVASLLLQNGADINSQTNGKQTPLHFAASGVGGTSTLQLLLCNRWLDASLLNKQNETALDIANRSGQHYKLFEIVEDCINIKY